MSLVIDNYDVEKVNIRQLQRQPGLINGVSVLISTPENNKGVTFIPEEIVFVGFEIKITDYYCCLARDTDQENTKSSLQRIKEEIADALILRCKKYLENCKSNQNSPV